MSLDLQREFPNADGFSTTNLWYMKQWYLFYSQEDTKLQQLVGEIPSSKLHQAGGDIETLKLLQPAREFEETHHQRIIDKAKK